MLYLQIYETENELLGSSESLLCVFVLLAGIGAGKIRVVIHSQVVKLALHCFAAIMHSHVEYAIFLGCHSQLRTSRFIAARYGSCDVVLR